MKRLLGTRRRQRVTQTTCSLSLFVCLGLTAPGCSKDEGEASTDFSPISLTVDGKELRFEYRAIDPPISVGAPLKQERGASAHQAWLLAYHHQANSEYQRLVDLAMDTDQAKNYVAGLEKRTREKNEESFKKTALQQMVAEIRVDDRYMVLMTKPKEDGGRQFTAQCAVEKAGAFKIIAVPYYRLDDFRVLFDVLEALKAGKWKLGRGD